MCFSLRRNFVFLLIALLGVRRGCAGDPAYTRVAGKRRPTRSCEASRSLALGEAAVEPVDELGHLLEPVGDHADAVLAEVLRLDAERLRRARSSTSFDGTGPVAVHEVVEVAGREAGLRGEAAVGDAPSRPSAARSSRRTAPSLKRAASRHQSTSFTRSTTVSTRDALVRAGRPDAHVDARRPRASSCRR